jgi:hypothetical protein
MAEYFKLYSAALRRHVETRAPYWEAANADIEVLKATEAWKHRPSVITDQDGRIIDTNQIDVEHYGF